ncbi:unnamed protein product [Urochloa humidicola]
MACPEPDFPRWRKVIADVPEGVHVPMCFCGDLCKLMKSKVLGVYYGMRFFMCDNFEYDPPKLSGRMRPKWLDKEQSEEDKAYVEEEASSARVRWQRMMHDEQQEEKRKKDQEDIRKRMEDIERQEAQEREAERERKRERARRAKAAGSEAIRKGKYPRCTQ